MHITSPLDAQRAARKSLTFSVQQNPQRSPNPDEIYGHLDPDRIFGWDEASLREWLKGNEEKQFRQLLLLRWRGNEVIDSTEMAWLPNKLEALTKSLGHKVPDGFFTPQDRDGYSYVIVHKAVDGAAGDTMGATSWERDGNDPALSIEGYIREMKRKYAEHYAAYRKALEAYNKTPVDALSEKERALKQKYLEHAGENGVLEYGDEMKKFFSSYARGNIISKKGQMALQDDFGIYFTRGGKQTFEPIDLRRLDYNYKFALKCGISKSDKGVTYEELRASTAKK